MHTRAFPICGRIVPWTPYEKVKKLLPNGETCTVTHSKLICPEHGEFRNPAELRALGRINGGAQ